MTHSPRRNGPRTASRSEITRVVLEDSPDLIEAMERAAEEFHRHEESWQGEVGRHERKALKEAAAAVVEKSKELLAAGAVTRRTTGINER